MIRPYAHPWPRTTPSQAAPPHIFRRHPPGCATHPACCSHLAPCAAGLLRDLLGTTAVAMASSRHPSPRPRCLPHSGTRIPCPPSGHRPPALRAVSASHWDSASPRCCAAVQHRPCSYPCPTLLPHACLPACPAPILQSPIRRSPHAAARPLSSDAAGGRSPGRFRQLRSEQRALVLPLGVCCPD